MELFEQPYSNHLDIGQVWHLNDPNMSGCQMVQFLNGGLKIGQNVYYMVQHVWYLTGPPNHMIRPLKTGQKVSINSNVWISGVWYSDGYCILRVYYSNGRSNHVTIQ